MGEESNIGRKNRSGKKDLNEMQSRMKKIGVRSKKERRIREEKKPKKREE